MRNSMTVTGRRTARRLLRVHQTASLMPVTTTRLSRSHGDLRPSLASVQHLDWSALEYIRWRYEIGEDREGLDKVDRAVRP